MYNSLRSHSIVLWCFIFLQITFVQSVWAVDKANPSKNQLLLESVIANYDSNVLTLVGVNFTKKGFPTVKLGVEELFLQGITDTQILADLPLDILDGDYVLSVANGPSPNDFDSSFFTVKAVYFTTQLEISSAIIDLEKDTLTLTGRNFDNGLFPAMVLAAQSLVVDTYDGNNIRAFLPQNIAELDGSYVLTITTGEKLKHRGSYTVVIDPEYSLDSKNGTIKDVVIVDPFGAVTVGSGSEIYVSTDGKVQVGSVVPGGVMVDNDGDVQIGTGHTTQINLDGVVVDDVGDVSLRNNSLIINGNGVTSNVNFEVKESLTTNKLVADVGVGIGTDMPAAALHVTDTVYYDSDALNSSNNKNRNHFIALFENKTPRLDGADGIAIKLHHDTPVDGNNTFIAFLNKDNEVAGEIRGYTQGVDFSAPPTTSLEPVTTSLIRNLIGLNLGLTTSKRTFFPGFSLTMPPGIPNIGIPKVAFSIPTGIKAPSFSPCNIFDLNAATTCLFASGNSVDQWVEWSYQNDLMDFMADSPFGIAVAAIKLAKYHQHNGSGGITYASKGADYAEWLLKRNVNETLHWGSIVGVNGGQVSLNTQDVDHVMVVSRAPIVLGNMPPIGEEDKYAMVGFLGQLLVAVHGPVAVGDYIVTSGYNNGLGVAVSPEDISLLDVPNIVGRAWEASDDFGSKMINVAVGMRSTELAKIMSTSVDRINMLENQLEHIERRLSGVEARL